MSVTKSISDQLPPSPDPTIEIEEPPQDVQQAEYLPMVSVLAQAAAQSGRNGRRTPANGPRQEVKDGPVIRTVLADENAEPADETTRNNGRGNANSAGLALVLPRGAMHLEEQARARRAESVFNMGGSSTTELALASFTRRPLPQLPASREPIFAEPGGYNIPLADSAFAPLPGSNGINLASWIVVVVLLCLSVAVGYYIYDSRQQWAAINDGMTRASQNQTFLAEQAKQLDQRAWVGLSQTSLRPMSDTRGGFTVKIQNTGKTPASSVRVASIIQMQGLDELTDVPASEERPQAEAGVLMPGGSFSVPVWFESSPEAIDDLMQGKVRAVNYLTVTYTDIFKQTHTTRACFYWYGTLHSVQPCERFNSAD